MLSRTALQAWLPPWWLAALSLMLLGALFPRLTERLDLIAFDLTAPALPATSRSVVIAIDDASLAALGQWPWSRQQHAHLLDRLRQAGASRVAFDVLFAEAADTAGDAAFAAALQRMPGTVLASAPGPEQPTGQPTAVLPLPTFQALSLTGHVQVPIDADGAVRRLAAWAGPETMRQPALALAATAGPEATSPTAAHTPPQWLPPWAEGTAALRQIPFVQALSDPDLSRQVQGRTVFVGVTAAGLDQPLQTPWRWREQTVSAVHLHAQAFEALAQQATLTPLTGSVQWLAQLGTVVAALLCWPGPGAGWRGLGGRRGVVAVALPGLVSLALLSQHLWLAPGLPTLAVLAALLARLVLRSSQARRDGQRVRQEARATMQAVGDAVIVVRPDGRIAHVNPSAERLATGAWRDGTPLGDAFTFTPTSWTHLQQALATAARRPDRLTLDAPLHLQTLSGTRSLRATVLPMRDAHGAWPGLVLALSDITDALAATARLLHSSRHDPLTQLPNRSVLAERLAAALAQGPARQTALLFVNLDRFQRINDSLGHGQGDELLRETARRLLTVVRPDDTVVRWGGDEFAVLMPGVVHPSEAAAAAERLVAALGQDIDLDGLRVSSSCSVGVVLAPGPATRHDPANATDLEPLIALASAAMHAAKAQPGQRWRFSDAATSPWTRDRLSLETDLRRALADDAFELHLQPQVAAATGALVGFEALLRWRHPSGRLVMPIEFIGLAEESRLILEVGHWVLREAARVVAQRQRLGLAPVPVSVNVSALQCLDRGLVQALGQVLSDTGIPPGLLTLEITESAAMTGAAQVHALLGDIHALGVKLALDDFGTGYSSLTYLKRFPIDELKIDRSFVHDIDSDPDSAAIVRATVAMAHERGLTVVAEGVETAVQQACLQRLGCDRLQGFLFAPALPAHEAMTWQPPEATQAHPPDRLSALITPAVELAQRVLAASR